MITTMFLINHLKNEEVLNTVVYTISYNTVNHGEQSTKLPLRSRTLLDVKHQLISKHATIQCERCRNSSYVCIFQQVQHSIWWQDIQTLIKGIWQQEGYAIDINLFQLERILMFQNCNCSYI